MFTRRSSMSVMRSCVKRSSRRSSRRSKSRPNYSTFTVAVLAALLITVVQLHNANTGPGRIMLDDVLQRTYLSGSVTLVDKPEALQVTDLTRFGSSVDQAFELDYDLAKVETDPDKLVNAKSLHALQRVVLEKGFVKAPPRAWGTVMVPEPNTALLLGMGLTLLAVHKRRNELV
jgi:hypothetical protein